MAGYSFCLTQNTADTGISILDERSCITIEIDTFLRIEEHVLTGIDLQDEVLQSTHTHDASHLLAFCLTHIVEFSQFHRGFQGIIDHQLHQIVGIDNGSLTALHLAVWQFYHTVGEMHEFLTPLET